MKLGLAEFNPPIRTGPEQKRLSPWSIHPSLIGFLPQWAGSEPLCSTEAVMSTVQGQPSGMMNIWTHRLWFLIWVLNEDPDEPSEKLKLKPDFYLPDILVHFYRFTMMSHREAVI